MFNSHATQDSLNTGCDGGGQDENLIQLFHNIDSQRLPHHHMSNKETPSSQFLHHNRTSISPNLDSLLFNTAVGSSDMRLSNNNHFGNISEALQPFPYYHDSNLERQ